MISWIQKNLQGHFRYVFLVLLAATIIMFVFTIGNQGWGSGGDSRKQYVQSFFDLDLGKPADQARLIGDAAMSVRLQAGYDLFHGAQLQQYALRRYALIHIASTLGLPPPDVNEVAAHIAGMGLFAGQDGKFDEKRYNEFRDSLRTNPGAGEGDINRVIVDDMRARSAETLLAGPGYALSGDVKRQLVRADTEWTIGLATVDFAGFAPEIPVTDALLEAFLQKNPAAYEIPAMARVACVEFKAADFAAEVSLTDKEIREFYDINPARFPANTAKDGIAKTELSLAATPGVNPDADFAAARPRVEEALRADRAKRRAARAASELSLALYEAKITPATLAGFLGARKLAERALQPFAAGQGPAELGGSAKIGAEAFKLGADRVFSDVVESPDGYAILVFKELQPARPARLSEIRARLEADYIAGQKRGLFAEAGARLKRHIEERLKAGDSFEAAATSGAGLLSGAKVSVKNFGKFTLRNPPEGLSPAMFAALEDIRQGQVADMVTGGETQDGLIAYAAERKEPAVDPQSPQFAQMRARIGQLLAAQSLNEQINLLLQKELAKVIPE